MKLAIIPTALLVATVAIEHRSRPKLIFGHSAALPRQVYRDVFPLRVALEHAFK
jgi:hypothetical protein